MSSSDPTMPSSGHGSLVVESDIDVRIALYDGAGARVGERHGELAADVPVGLYRVEVERAGRVESFVIEHGGNTRLRPPAPVLRTPAPIAGAETSHEYYTETATHLSVATTAPGLGPEPRTGHLLIFIRREARDRGPHAVPSEPIGVLDVNGRPLAALTHGDVARDESAGYLAYAAHVAPGIYRLRAARSRRDFAIAIPPHRSAQVFIADTGDLRVDDLRIFLPVAGRAFVPSSPVGHAMEGVLDALRAPHAELPSSVVPLLAADDLDLCLGIAAAHLLLRGRDGAPGLLDALIGRLAPYADHSPDIAILQHAWRRRRGEPIGPLALSAPPMLRASFLAAMTGPDISATHVPDYSAIAQSARGGHHDSVWWTWSSRPWDARWIEPTIDRLLAQGGSRNLLSIARTIALPVATIAQTIAQIDATIPQVDQTPLAIRNANIPGYALCERLGRGSQGEVYRAIREQDRQPVAIKVIAFTGDRRQRQAAMREIQAMEPLDHPSLLRLAESGPLPDDSGMWLELELCRGSVEDRLAELDAPMAVDEACRIMCQALEGIAYLHDRGIVHRDLKPANLLIRSDDSVAVADFGLARSAALRSKRPRAGGTARFAPPEQLVDVSQATPASDVWSAAATLYFMLTLELPRSEYADQSELDAARHNPIVPIAERRPDLPPALASIIDAALSIEQFRRPPGAASLRRHLTARRAAVPHGAWGGGRRGRALVIGGTSPGFDGIENDAWEIGRLLEHRGFEVELRTNAGATTAGVRDGFDRLVEATHTDDSVVIYYSGRAFAFAEQPSHDAVFSLALSEGDSLQPLELPLGRLLKRTRNVTVITDACLSTGAAFSAPSLPVVQISGCGAEGVAFEYTNARGVRRGVFTESLVEVFCEIGSLPFSWAAIGRAVRARVIRRFPSQAPQFVGPVDRQPFSLANGDDHDDGVYEVHQAGDRYVVRGGDLAGVVIGDRFAAMPPGSFSYDAAAALGELEVVEVLPAVVIAKLNDGTAALPDGAVAVAIVKHGAKRPVTIDLHPVSPRFIEAVAGAPTLRIARPGERAIATVTSRDRELTLADELGLLCSPGELGRQYGPVIQALSNLAAAQALRELEGEYGIALDEVEITLATTVHGDVRLLPRHRAVLGLADRLCVSVANRSHRRLFAHVFAIGPRGDISLLGIPGSAGIVIEPNAPPHVLRDIALPWDPGMPRTTPRVVDIVAIITAKPTRLDRLTTARSTPGAPRTGEPDETRGSQRSVFNSALQDLFDQLHDGQLRELHRERVDDFFVTRLPLLLVPLGGELARLAFELDRDLLARNIARVLRAPTPDPRRSAAGRGWSIAVRIADVSPRSGLRLDALICTQSEDGRPVTWTSRVDGSPELQLFEGQVRGFVDIALFTSPDADGPALAELLDARRGDPVLEEAVSALRGTGPSSVALALGASAVITRRVYEILRNAIGATHCLYHSSFLAEEDFGVSRYPASGVYHGKEISLAVAIEGPRSSR